MPVAENASYKAFKEMLAEKEAREKEKEGRMIGPFIFDNDEDIDCEVLTNDQVYADLIELDEILGANITEEQEISAKGALSKPKRKR
jgi:CRISPR/Cas system CMR-associated protein Cmr3 (group 5 of RAMP superfamily)